MIRPRMVRRQADSRRREQAGRSAGTHHDRTRQDSQAVCDSAILSLCAALSDEGPPGLPGGPVAARRPARARRAICWPDAVSVLAPVPAADETSGASLAAASPRQLRATVLPVLTGSPGASSFLRVRRARAY